MYYIFLYLCLKNKDMIIKIKGNEYLLTGTHSHTYTCDGTDFILWYHDIKDVVTGKHYKNIKHKRLKKYL